MTTTITRAAHGWWWELRRPTGTAWPVLIDVGYARTRLGARVGAWWAARKFAR